MYQSMDGGLWVVSVALVMILIIAWIIGGIARWLLRDRASLNVTSSMVLAILGAAMGLLIAYLIDNQAVLRSWLALGCGVGVSIIVISVYSVVAAHFQRPRRIPIAELIGSGESDTLEFKSTARVNLRTGEKDSRMEQVIVKTVSAFLNSGGGVLLVGVDDAGTPLGLDADYATLKTPDSDRFELWLRDLFATTLGQNAATEIAVQIDDVIVGDAEPAAVCLIRCGPSPRPVYLRPGKNAMPEFWVRTGNSTRQLSVDQAADYVMHRWPLGPGTALAAQVRSAVRLSVE